MSLYKELAQAKTVNLSHYIANELVQEAEDHLAKLGRPATRSEIIENWKRAGVYEYPSGHPTR